eukprot:3586085-Prymnesium_polylepis.1
MDTGYAGVALPPRGPTTDPSSLTFPCWCYATEIGAMQVRGRSRRPPTRRRPYARRRRSRSACLPCRRRSSSAACPVRPS